MVATANVFNLLANKFARLGRGGLAQLRIAAGAVNRLFFRHGRKGTDHIDSSAAKKSGAASIVRADAYPGRPRASG
jgi:hypothetical protein